MLCAPSNFSHRRWRPVADVVGDQYLPKQNKRVVSRCAANQSAVERLHLPTKSRNLSRRRSWRRPNGYRLTKRVCEPKANQSANGAQQRKEGVLEREENLCAAWLSSLSNDMKAFSQNERFEENESPLRGLKQTFHRKKRNRFRKTNDFSELKPLIAA